MAPEVLHQLGDKADGVYLLTQQAPPSDKDNPGIQQMLKELKDAGFDANGDEMSPAVTGAWSNVHTLVDILKKLPPAEIATLDSAKLVDAMAKAGPINRPEIAPFDFTANAFPDIASLSGFRIYTETGDGHARGGREVRPSVCLQRRDEAVQARELTVLVATEFLSQTTLRFVLLGMATGALTALVALRSSSSTGCRAS